MTHDGYQNWNLKIISYIIKAERAHRRDTSMAAKNTKRLFDVDNLH